MTDALQILVIGVTVGSSYALVATGFNVIHNATGILNFAQGETVMLGGLVAATLSFHLSPLLSVVAAVMVVAVIHCAAYMFTIRPARQSSYLNILLITFGLALLSQALALRLWGTDPRTVKTLVAGSLNVSGVIIRYQSILIAVIALVGFAFLAWFFRWTYTGRAMRAVSMDLEMAEAFGVDSSIVSALAFGIAGALGGLAGGLVAAATAIQFNSGIPFVLKGFTAFVAGGSGSLQGGYAAGVGLGIVEALLLIYGPSRYTELLVMLLLLMLLFFRPHGLLGSPRQARA